MKRLAILTTGGTIAMRADQGGPGAGVAARRRPAERRAAVA